MRLEDALRFNGYTIEPLEIAASSITLSTGVLEVPAMLGSQLIWRRDGSPTPIESLYLTTLPIFAAEYQPVVLSQILDRFRTRRIGYSMLDQFALAVRRWGNLNLGPQSIINQRYLSSLVDLPLNTIDLAVDATDNTTTSDTGTVGQTGHISDTSGTTDKGRQVGSMFPQTIVGSSVDYADDAEDHANQVDATGSSDSNSTQTRNLGGTNNKTEHRTEVGRSGISTMQLLAEQREARINADAELLDAFEVLFLQVWDQPEIGGGASGNPASSPGYYGYNATGW